MFAFPECSALEPSKPPYSALNSTGKPARAESFSVERFCPGALFMSGNYDARERAMQLRARTSNVGLPPRRLARDSGLFNEKCRDSLAMFMAKTGVEPVSSFESADAILT